MTRQRENFAKLYVSFWRHPKVIRRSFAAVGLHARLLAFCREANTGVIHTCQMPMMGDMDEMRPLLNELCEALPGEDFGLLLTCAEGWEIHDWDADNGMRTRAEMSADGADNHADMSADGGADMSADKSADSNAETADERRRRKDRERKRRAREAVKQDTSRDGEAPRESADNHADMSADKSADNGADMSADSRACGDQNKNRLEETAAATREDARRKLRQKISDGIKADPSPGGWLVLAEWILLDKIGNLEGWCGSDDEVMRAMGAKIALAENAAPVLGMTPGQWFAAECEAFADALAAGDVRPKRNATRFFAQGVGSWASGRAAA